MIMIYGHSSLQNTNALVGLLFLKAGIHPTIAGVLPAFTIPIRQRMAVSEYNDQIIHAANKFQRSNQADSTLLSDDQIACLDNLEGWTGKVQSPLQHLEHKLHGLVAYCIMPVFALFNAGIALSSFKEVNANLAFSITAALIIGKVIGINLMTYIGIRSG